MSGKEQLAGLVLAAGRGSRFQSETGQPFPKVLRPLLGRPMVAYVLDALAEAGVSDVALVVGFQAEEVRRAVGPSVAYVPQEQQKGSGHAVACASERFRDFSGQLVVMCGDSPLFCAGTVRSLMSEHVATGAAATLATAVLDDPFGYGRVMRDSSGRIRAIVEEKCASEDQRAIREVNGGLLAFDAPWLFASLREMAVNEANEYNLTDMVRVALEQGRTVSAVSCDPLEMLGVNTPAQLASVEEILRRRTEMSR